MKDMTGRIRCCVPGCGRTFKREGDEEEVVCGKHWRLADARLRRVITMVRRKARRLGWSHALACTHDRLWYKCRDQAIERAMGI